MVACTVHCIRECRQRLATKATRASAMVTLSGEDAPVDNRDPATGKEGTTLTSCRKQPAIRESREAISAEAAGSLPPLRTETRRESLSSTHHVPFVHLI
jgi:hypothetical protein